MPDLEQQLETLLEKELVLSKVDVARRQLDTSIKMFFFDEDVVSTYTVASAAHTVIRDLCHHQEIAISIKDSPLIKEEARKDYLKAFNRPQNFFKHSDKDPEDKLIFRYQATFLPILDAVIQFAVLERELTHKMKTFLMWAQLMFPDLLSHLPTEEHLKEIRGSTNDPESFKLLAKTLILDEDR